MASRHLQESPDVATLSIAEPLPLAGAPLLAALGAAVALGGMAALRRRKR